MKKHSVTSKIAIIKAKKSDELYWKKSGKLDPILQPKILTINLPPSPPLLPAIAQTIQNEGNGNYTEEWPSLKESMKLQLIKNESKNEFKTDFVKAKKITSSFNFKIRKPRVVKNRGLKRQKRNKSVNTNNNNINFNCNFGKSFDNQNLSGSGDFFHQCDKLCFEYEFKKQNYGVTQSQNQSPRSDTSDSSFCDCPICVNQKFQSFSNNNNKNKNPIQKIKIRPSTRNFGRNSFSKIPVNSHDQEQNNIINIPDYSKYPKELVKLILGQEQSSHLLQQINFLTAFRPKYSHSNESMSRNSSFPPQINTLSKEEKKTLEILEKANNQFESYIKDECWCGIADNYLNYGKNQSCVLNLGNFEIFPMKKVQQGPPPLIQNTFPMTAQLINDNFYKHYGQRFAYRLIDPLEMYDFDLEACGDSCCCSFNTINSNMDFFDERFYKKEFN